MVRKEAWSFLQNHFPVSAYVGSSKSLKDLKALGWVNAFSAVLSTEGRVVGLCWAKSNLKDLKAHL